MIWSSFFFPLKRAWNCDLNVKNLDEIISIIGSIFILLFFFQICVLEIEKINALKRNTKYQTVLSRISSLLFKPICQFCLVNLSFPCFFVIHLKTHFSEILKKYLNVVVSGDVYNKNDQNNTHKKKKNQIFKN